MGSYRERLLVPVSYWLLAIPVVLTLGAEAYFFVDGFIPPLVIAALYAIVAAFLVHWNSATIEVAGAVLRAGKDTLALSDVDASASGSFASTLTWQTKAFARARLQRVR